VLRRFGVPHACGALQDVGLELVRAVGGGEEEEEEKEGRRRRSVMM
jgi:hypothetical protein